MSTRGRARSRVWLAGMASVVALTVAGCGGGDNGNEVASAGHGKTSAGSTKKSSSELADYIEAQRKWVGCLRDAGLDAADPDAHGRVDLGITAKSKQDPKILKAQEKCAKLSVPVPESVERANQPELTKEEISRNKKYASCMQEHGAPDFPDVDETGRSPEVTWDSTSAGAKRATRECGPIIGVPTNPPPAKG
ncbi:hypothetical protein [Streptomyces sp. NPDC001020]